MSKKSLFILFILLLTLIILSFNKPQNRNTSSQMKGLLSFDINQVKQMEIKKGSDGISFLKQDEKWFVKDKITYPADNSAVNTLLIKLHELKSNQIVTENKENFNRLEVSNEKAQSITLKDQNKNEISTLLIGKERESNTTSTETGFFVRAKNQDKVFLAFDVPQADFDELSEWLNKTIVNFKPQSIEKIELLDIKPKVTIKPNKETDENKELFEFVGLKNGDKPKSWAAQSSVNLYENFSFGSVYKKDDDKIKSLKFKEKSKLTTKNGLIYIFSFTQEETDSYVKITVDQNADTISKLESDEKKKAEESYKKDKEFLEKWVYQIETWDASNINKSYKDLIEEKPVEQSKTEKVSSNLKSQKEQKNLEAKSAKPFKKTQDSKKEINIPKTKINKQKDLNDIQNLIPNTTIPENVEDIVREPVLED